MRERIREFLVENFLFGESDVDFVDDASLLRQGIIDSTGVLELVSFLEEEFELQVTDEEIVPDYLDSVNKLVAFIKNKQSNAACAGDRYAGSKLS